MVLDLPGPEPLHLVGVAGDGKLGGLAELVEDPVGRGCRWCVR